MPSYTREQMTASPVQLDLPGLSIKLYPLSDADISELDRWVRARFVQTARDSLPPDATQAEREETLLLAMREAGGLTFMRPPGSDMLATVDGITRLIMQSARDQKLTLDQVRQVLLDPKNIEEVNAKFKELHPKNQEPSTPAARLRALKKPPRKK